MKPARLLSASLFCALPLLAGCSLFVATNADINDGSIERTAENDNRDRLRRMRESGALRPGEYEALENRLGTGADNSAIAKPSVEELEKRVQENRKATADGAE